MSAGEAAALVSGLVRTERKMERVPPPGPAGSPPRSLPTFVPDNRCCHCLTLTSGSLLIASLNTVAYLAAFTWYLTTDNLDTPGLRKGGPPHSLDLAVFSFCLVKILVNILLGVAALRRLPCQTLPWLAAYAVSMLLSMILIVVVLLFGTTKLELTYNEWVTGLALLGLLTGANFFCWIVVFTLRKNLMMEGQIERSCSTDAGVQCSSLLPTAPPPSYREVEEKGGPPRRLQEEDAPPGYDAVMAEQAETNATGPVLRKKSLTNNAV